MINKNSSKVLVAGPIFDGMEYCVGDFLDRLKSLSYDNYDIFLVDNSGTRDFAKRLERDYGVNVLHLDLKNMTGMKKIVRCRNRIFTYAVENGYDHVLMMDSDVIPPIDIIERLLLHKKDVVSGLYFGLFNVNRKQEVKSVAWKCLTEAEWDEVRGQLMSDIVKKREDIRRNLTEEEINSGKLQEVIIPSAGCMLVSQDVFSKFKYGVLDVPSKFSSGDDIYFCRKVREAGIKLYCDPSVKCKHLTEGKFSEDGIHPLHK